MARCTRLVALLVLLAPTLALASGPRREPTLVSTDWLGKRLRDPALVVLHVSSQRADFDAGHVPGARFIGWSDLTTVRDSLSVELPAASRLDSLFESAGIGPGSRIVVTGTPVTAMARLLVTLDHVGLGDRASILDGGIDAWRDEGRPLSRDSAAVARGSLAPRTGAERVVNADWVRRHVESGTVAVVDARTPEFFQGLASSNNPRPGRLPAAGNVPFTWLTRELGRFREPRELARLFARAGVRRDQPVVTYCHIGIQACVAYVAARSLGHDVHLYDGSFEDWSRRGALPVDMGEASAR